MNKVTYLRSFEQQMQRLEAGFAKGFAPILNSMWRAAAKEVAFGNIHGADIVVDRYTQRQRDFLSRRYLLTADVFGKQAREFYGTKSKVGMETKAPLSPQFWAAMEQWAYDLAATKVSMIDITSKRLIADAVMRGIREGNSNAEIATTLRQIGQITSKTRANMIARTETHTAANYSTKYMATNLGGDEKQWMNAGDRRVRNAHRHVSTEWIPVDEKFDVGGERLDYPGDSAGSSANVTNCRCTALYRNGRNA